MKQISLYLLFFVLSFHVLFAQKAESSAYQKELNVKEWKLTFEDKGTKLWQSNWFLDGLQAKVQNTKKGMLFTAGPVAGDDACHAVLWTKKSFSGDVKIEYDYTRTDTATQQVNILYIQATGVDPYDVDISKWSDQRTIPSMRIYFNNMNCLHISYAAFGNMGEYVRARKYPVLKGEDFNTTTEIPPAYFNTGLFVPGKTYRVTVLKNDNYLFFNVRCKGESSLFAWKIDSVNLIREGRIGFRHMYTRSARYANIKIYEKK